MQGPPASTLFPYTTLFRSRAVLALRLRVVRHGNDDLRLELMDDLGGLRGGRSEEHTSELQSQFQLVCRLLLEKKKPRHGGMEPGSRSGIGKAAAGGGTPTL